MTLWKVALGAVGMAASAALALAGLDEKAGEAKPEKKPEPAPAPAADPAKGGAAS